MSWEGFYETEDDMIHILIEHLTFRGDSFACEWVQEDGTKLAIDGSLGKKDKKKNRKVEFTLTRFDQGKKTRSFFSGSIDPLRTRMKGKWGHRKGQPVNLFEFRIVESVPATLSLKFSGEA